MIRFFQIALVISILVGATLQKSTKALASSRGCKYQLTFHDEFNGTNLDPTKWNVQYPSGNGGEQQFYTPEAISLQDGVLKITAEKRSMQGYPFTSGIITTKGTFSQQYGIFSMRAKLPNGKGFW